MDDANPTIDKKTADFIRRQPVFFVSTAPLSTDGFLNLSPKGLDSFRILDSSQVAYADYVGSGVETVAHVKENGRIVLMFCAFDENPGIIRLHGKARVIEASEPEFDQWICHFPARDGVRSVIVVDCHRVARTCGFGVPLMTFERHRDELPQWCDRQGEKGLANYQRRKNTISLDGLPGINVSRSGD